AENVVPATDNADGTYTMTFTAAGTYTISAAKDGFNDVVSSEFSVNAKPVDTEKVTKSVEETLKNVNGGGKAASLPTNAAVDGENKDIAYKVEGGKAAIEISEDGTKTLKLNDNAFAAKVDLVATVDGVDVHKTVYLKADSTTQIAFGNLALISNAEGADAFTDDDKFSAALADAANKAAVELTRAEALNYVINNSQPNDVIASAIDYDSKDGITLSEYRMFKLLINGNTDFSASKISVARAALTNADSAQETTNE
ncbi:MAG: carboxypeptidase regulatory-like domain-containing protein, partial [Clostridiales bacterium]|nr:carboxypeptidase regulatory-like domain-containing protein [Clostridiales bacterium]